MTCHFNQLKNKLLTLKTFTVPIINIRFKIDIDYNKILEITLSKIIASRAYRGYCEFVIRDDATPLPKKDFLRLDFWKIKLSFKMYFCYFKGENFLKYNSPFIRTALLNY